MTTNIKIASEIQKLAPGKLVALYELNMTGFGGTTIYFTENATVDGAIVQLNGVAYIPIDCKSEGFEYSGTGSLPRPKITIANVSQSLVAEIAAYDDLVGAVLTRRRTFAKYLDDGSAADSNAQFPTDIWVIERKSMQNKFFIEWELSAYLDSEGTVLPKGQVLRDTCLLGYRIYVAGAFVYTNATCPYTGANYYKRNGDSTGNPALDICGKKLSDCVLRFPNASLPLSSFPSVSKARV